MILESLKKSKKQIFEDLKAREQDTRRTSGNTTRIDPFPPSLILEAQTQVKNKRERDKIGTKPEQNRTKSRKNGKSGEARKSQKQSQSVEQEKLNKMQKEGPKMHTQSKSIKAYKKERKKRVKSAIT
nr:hypothetical protein [Tanacetum cinerariifolium]